MRNRGMNPCPDYNQRIYPMNNMKKLTLALLLALNMTCAFCQKTDTIRQKSNNTWYVMADIPSLAISGDRSYMKCNFLQGYGFGFEYVINGKVAVGLDLYRERPDVRFVETQAFQTCSGLQFKPSFKVYLDSYKKLYAGLGMGFRFCQESQGSDDELNSQRYWQSSLRLGFGYKVYVFKNRRFGLDSFVGSNLLLWGNSEPWTTALARRGIFFEFSLFYKF